MSETVRCAICEAVVGEAETEAEAQQMVDDHTAAMKQSIRELSKQLTGEET